MNATDDPAIDYSGEAFVGDSRMIPCSYDYCLACYSKKQGK